MTINSDKIAYEKWFEKAFSVQEKDFLLSIGISCQPDRDFFKYEILDISDHITNHKLKKHIDLYGRFIDRFVELNPLYLRSLIDRDKLKTDDYYVAWFFNRHCFFENIRILNNDQLLLWAPIVDSYTPEDCRKYSNIVFQKNEIIEIAINHWEKPQSGCRCCSIILSHKQFLKGIDDGKFDSYRSTIFL